MNKQTRDCPVCGSNQKRVIFNQYFTAMSAGGLTGYDVVICDKCGFVFADNIPNQSSFDAYYHNLSKYEHYSADGSAIEKRELQLEMIAQFIDGHLSDHDGRILDVGCSNGCLIYKLKNHGYSNVIGLDPAPLCVEQAKRLYDVTVRTGTLGDVRDMGKYDLITMIAVLEHICDLREALGKLHQLLNPGGLLFFEVPDSTRFTFPANPYAPFMEFSIEHINYFSPNSLVSLLQTGGFRLVYLERKSYVSETNVILAMFQRVESEPLLDYIEKSNSAETHVFRILDELGDTPIIVWGAGSLTQRLLATGRLKNAIVFVDSNPNYRGGTLDGKQILAPDELLADAPILVSSYASKDAIIRQILSFGLANEIITLFEVDNGN